MAEQYIKGLMIEGMLFTRSSYGGTNSLAHKYVKSDTEAYYNISSDQVTIPKFYGTYEEILNEDGLTLLQSVKEKVAKGEFKDTFVKYKLERENSGSWFANQSSQFYDPSAMKGCFNSFYNVVICGYTQELLDTLDGELFTRGTKFMQTSSILFYTDEWAYTKSGSLYKLGEMIH
ncbi:hypothetical protein QKU48_gp0117 [Fadolivirus algeromassiliense]|jgi:hypothetical protein|uniref:Uncharacterized protein n=1 Tax=Fadolivirus FV1/VV64 TaxID=3070911 RepID=A0A7D3V560_9VIRU|nr:hypothetical protein QKU48_gp0117 [Fadolivirus algeromassiliense]QKF93575.1 hypothetical protein Fadolivirus_1_117 [Fadolivirus FV1/VV64]